MAFSLCVGVMVVNGLPAAAIQREFSLAGAGGGRHVPDAPSLRLSLVGKCGLTGAQIEKYWRQAVRDAYEVNTKAKQVRPPSVYLVELPDNFPCEDTDQGGRLICSGWFVTPGEEPTVILFSHKDHDALEHEFLHLILWQIDDPRWGCSMHRNGWQKSCTFSKADDQ